MGGNSANTIPTTSQNEDMDHDIMITTLTTHWPNLAGDGYTHVTVGGELFLLKHACKVDSMNKYLNIILFG